MRRLSFNFMFQPRDFWIGIHFDPVNKRLFILPLPMFGLIIRWGHADGCPYMGACMKHCGFDDGWGRP